MAVQHILDSHIHLMPGMGFGFSGFSTNEYKTAVASAQTSSKVRSLEYPSLVNYSSSDSASNLATNYQVDGFIYVETNRGVRPGKEIAQWASEPLKEIAMLKRIVEGTPQAGEGNAGDGKLVKGIVPWAPIDRGYQTFQDYIAIAQKTAGKETWSRVKGFRFMLEMLFTEQRFKTVLEDAQTIRTLASFGETWAFDIGVNTHLGGVWQLERAATFMEAVSKTAKTRFVINHLTKPNLAQVPTTEQQKQDFTRWKAAITRLGKLPNVYMKLSGAYSEMGFTSASLPVDQVVQRVSPWFDHTLQAFGAKRILFGSDWPVSTGANKAWASWKDVVAELMLKANLSDEDKDRIWRGTAAEAYRI